MVDTRTLARILEHAHARRMTLVLVGDPNQLREIGAGGLFARLTRHTIVGLTKNRRQVAQWEQKALSALRFGDVPTALDAYYSHRRVHISAHTNSSRTHLHTTTSNCASSSRSRGLYLC
jgi:ATP-dependent exoDNAse (exonuclease V) alpha subunit